MGVNPSGNLQLGAVASGGSRAGIRRENINDSFWRKKGYVPEDDDVVIRTSHAIILPSSPVKPTCRTKQFLSDPAFLDEKPLLFLPASVVRGCLGDRPPGGDSMTCLKDCFFSPLL